MKVAISYRRADDSETLKQLLAALRGRLSDENVYLDVESTRIGENWMLRWLDAYGSADCILLVIGPQWRPDRLQESSDPVLLEVSGRWERIIPVLIDGASLPQRKELPMAMRPLLMRQAHVVEAQKLAESIARLLEGLERDRQPPLGWGKHLWSFRGPAPGISFDLTGEWELKSSASVPFTDIHIKQSGRVLNVWASGFYNDEIVGEGWVGIDRPIVSFTLASKQYGPAGILVLKYDTNSVMLTGRWMPPAQSMISALFSRLRHKKVSLKRK